jgi:predicted small lipoprotein YifL
MKHIFITLLVFTLTGCGEKHKPVSKKNADKAASTNAAKISSIQYSDKQLDSFLDSIGRLNTQALTYSASFYADSVFKNQQQLAHDTVISEIDLTTLKRAIGKGFISVKKAKRIFNNSKIDTACTEKSISLTYKKGLTPIEYYPFNKKRFDEYGVCIGDPDHCPNACLYFFKGNKIIAMHIFYTRFEAGLHHYKDTDGKTIVYYAFMFAEGSNEWWFNYFFYKYDGDKLIPVLNQLESGNVSMQLAARCLWFTTEVKKTNPLTIKMVYYDQFPDTNLNDFGPKLINDSTIVKYKWENQSKTLRGEYEKSGIAESQILSYYLPGDNILFINSHYKTLKADLFDITKRKRVLEYLSRVKNHDE